MSYILDALKKADAERERSGVPGLHAHPQDGLADTERSERGVPWPAIAIGAIVVLGGALAWVLLSQDGVRTPPLAAEDAQAPSPVPAPTPAPAPPAPPRAVAPMPPVATSPPPPAPAPEAPRTATTAPPVRPPPRPVPPPVRKTPAPAPSPAPPATAPVEPRVPWLNELPSAVRSGLPPLSISGAVYAPAPSARLLFLNGQVLREGQTTAEGVMVERIGPSSSELSAGGQRFQVRH